jgi:hypothetical protein
MTGEVDINDNFTSGIAAAADTGFTTPGDGGRILTAAIDGDDAGGATRDQSGVRLSSYEFGNTLDVGTYLAIAEFSSTDADGAYELGTMWALSPANYDAVKAGGITEAELNANNVATASQAEDDNSVVFLSNYYHGIVARRVTGWYDELKYATSLDDILTRSVPEPTSAVLLVLGLLVLVGRRRSS